MFKTEPSTPLVKPLTIWQHLAEAEERQWGHGMVDATNSQSGQSQASDTGDAILRHGTAVRKIHDYFSNLEARKCCLKLTLEANKTTFSNIRLVRHDGRDSGIEEGAMMKTLLEHRMTVHQLDSSEFRVFERAYLCASFPVLGAPDPPSAFSPSPVPNSSAPRLSYSGILSISRPTTPHSIPDSGLEDTEEDTTSLIPAETLCELLKRTFRLSDQRFTYYEHFICENYGKRSQQQVLAEELVNQLAALENNSNPFYNPHTFKSRPDVVRKGYDTWQQQERAALTELLGKFWHFSLPAPSLNFTAQLTGVHDDYCRLLAKLIRYESPYRADREEIGPAPASSLSSASVRLLKEFGLRYGVGEQYKKFVYLHYLAEHFDATVWYIQHVISTLKSIMDWLPSNRNHLVITQHEFVIVESSLHLLLGQTGNAITKMKRLFPQNRPPDGVAGLIELLGLSLSLKTYLSMKPTKSLEECLRKYAQEAFVTAYERHKMLAISEQRVKPSAGVCPKLLNVLIMNIRDEVADYRSSYQSTFERYFHITETAAQAFYGFLMSDVLQLCRSVNTNVSSSEIDVLLLSLAYRLNSLDHDWARYIPPESQRWREPFILLSVQWSLAVHSYCPLLILDAISGDRFQPLQLCGSFGSPTVSSYSQRGRSTSLRSLSASVRSAFSNVSSAHSTPVQLTREDSIGKYTSKQSPILESISDAKHQSAQDLSPFVDVAESGNDVPTRRLSTNSDTAMFLRNKDCGRSSSEVMTFTRQNVRHSNSLPSFEDKSAGFPQHSFANTNTFENIRGIGGSKRQEDEPSKQTLDVPRPSFFTRAHTAASVSSPSDSDSDDEELSKVYPPVIVVKSSTNLLRVESGDVIPSVDARIGRWPDKPLSRGIVRVPSAPVMSPQFTSPSHQDFPQPSTSLARSTAFSNKLLGDSKERDFLDSLKSELSAVSLPVAAVQSAVTATAPVSSSLVDLLVMLQRVAGVARTFCETICPVSSPTGARVHGFWDSVSFASGDLEDLAYCQDNAGARCQLFLIFSRIVCENLCLYSDNMLCMDVCGLPLTLAKRLVGPKLVEYLQTQRYGGRIWGCRHDVAGSTVGCYHYIDRETFLLCDRYEPVVQEMCTRINNVSSLFEVLKKYYENICTTFGIHDNEDVTNFLSDDTEETGYESGFLDDYVVIESRYGDLDTEFGPYGNESLSVMSTPCLTPLSGMKVPIFPVLECWRHMMSVLRAMCRILAYRVNLFVRDALALLLSPDLPASSVAERLQPVRDFLVTYLSALSDWLYGDCLRRTLQNVWLYIVEDFEEEVAKLKTGESNTERQAELLTHALSHMIRFMNNMGKGVHLDLLLAYSEDVSFRLQLHTLTTALLTALYQKLVAYYSVSGENTQANQAGDIPCGILRRMKLELQSRRKCFTGRQLIGWLLRNQERGVLSGRVTWSPRLEGEAGRPLVSRERAHILAQRLLDQGIILDVEATLSSERKHTSSVTSDEGPYPNITIHLDLEGHSSVEVRPSSNETENFDGCNRPPSSESTATTIRDSTSDSTREELPGGPGVKFEDLDPAPAVHEQPDTAIHVPVIVQDSGDFITSEINFNLQDPCPITPSGLQDLTAANIETENNTTTVIQQESGSNSCDPNSATVPTAESVEEAAASCQDSFANDKHSNHNKAGLDQSLGFDQILCVEDSTKLGAASVLESGNLESSADVLDCDLADVESLVDNKIVVCETVDDGPERFPVATGVRTDQADEAAGYPDLNNDNIESSHIENNTQEENTNSVSQEKLNPQEGESKPRANTTPQSSISQDTASWITSSSSNHTFQDGPQRFYVFSASASDSAPHTDHSSSQTFQHQPRELLGMVETCFHKKITPDYLLLILYARRRYDQTAKKFFKNVPEHVLSRLCQQADAPYTTCAGS